MIAKNNAIHIKSYAFAIRIVNAYKFLAESEKKFVLSKQLLRSGTAIGALVAEAHHAQSGADFLNKMNVALKEANETSYWLELLYKTEILADNIYNSLKVDNEELKKMLVCIINTSIKSI